MAPQFILITAPGKINLYLGVHPHGTDAEAEESGYHRVDTVMTAIDLADTIAMAPHDELLVRMVPEADFPMEQNSAYKAAIAMGEAFGRDPNFAILIDKHIPVRAGLGGPSADAAAVIMGLCYFWKIDATDPRIDAVARSIGSDVAFFLYGPPAYLSGRGDAMQEMYRPLTGTPLALVKPMNGGVSAADAYAEFDTDPVAPADIEPMLQAMRDHREQDIFANIHNNLGAAALKLSPETADILEWLRAQDNVRAVDVCGSGSCLFAVCNTQMAAEKIALSALKDHGWWAQAAKMEKSGPFIAVG